MRRRWATGVLAVAVIGLATLRGGAEEKSEAVKLFNGKDLTNFYTYLAKHGKDNDPNKVFTVVEEDGKPAIRVSGQDFGCFTTEKEFDNYRLIVEFKWGEETFEPRKDRARDSGVLLHCIGEDGGAGPWMESIECQMIEGGTGDFIVVGGKGKRPRITCEVEERGKQLYYKEGGKKVERGSGRINWWGRDPAWKDVKGFRGAKDVEKPVGQWNTLEVVCDGDTITNILNGVVVNKATNVTPTRGKILFQSEGAEVFFRRIDLIPLKK
ncbi:MAG TPA: DUF1080 domain-containing protein [Gemmataceae bacterium]